MKALIVFPVLWILHACEPVDDVQPGISCELIEISPVRGDAVFQCGSARVIVQ